MINCLDLPSLEMAALLDSVLLGDNLADSLLTELNNVSHDNELLVQKEAEEKRGRIAEKTSEGMESDAIRGCQSNNSRQTSAKAGRGHGT